MKQKGTERAHWCWNLKCGKTGCCGCSLHTLNHYVCGSARFWLTIKCEIRCLFYGIIDVSFHSISVYFERREQFTFKLVSFLFLLCPYILSTYYMLLLSAIVAVVVVVAVADADAVAALMVCACQCYCFHFYRCILFTIVDFSNISSSFANAIDSSKFDCFEHYYWKLKKIKLASIIMRPIYIEILNWRPIVQSTFFIYLRSIWVTFYIFLQNEANENIEFRTDDYRDLLTQNMTVMKWNNLPKTKQYLNNGQLYCT